MKQSYIVMNLVCGVAGRLRLFARDRSGATAIEYGMLAVGISVAIIATVFALGPIVNDMFVSVIAAFG